VQGYAFDARRRAAELAREVWGDEALASHLDAAAEELQERFDRAFWIDDRGTYALALDREKRQVDALCSNLGHLLWSGIVPPERVEAITSTLVADDLWSGWGLRTMGAREAAFNPLSYHNGTVWPHDTALAAWGLANEGMTDCARLLARSLIEAAASFDYSLPEVFAGFSRSETTFPVAYPTAARPQAWAAGAPVLCLRLLLGLSPDRKSGTLRADASTPAPGWLEGTILEGVRALGTAWTVKVENGTVGVTPES
jgi:glycogen debranching enzyme